MNPTHTSLDSQYLPINPTHNSSFLKSLLRKAWQKSLNFAQNLIEFTAQHSKSQKTFIKQSPQSEVPKNQHKQLHEQNLNSRRFSNTEIKSSQIETNNFPNSHDLYSLFDPTCRKANQNIKQDERIRLPPKRRECRVKLLVIPDQQGRLNVKEIMKKLNEEKQQKIKKQSLKISRSQFKFFQPHSFDDKLQGKSLNDIFRPQKVEVNNSRKQQSQPQKDLKRIDEKYQVKTPFKGSCQQGEQKMINQNSPGPIIFRGDLSTILQSSTQDAMSDKIVSKGQILSQLLIEKKQTQEPEVKEKNTTDGERQKKFNPFLAGLKERQLPNGKQQNNVLQSMRMKLFSPISGSVQTVNKQVITKSDINNNIFARKESFVQQHLLNPSAPHVNNMFDRNQKLKLIAPNSYQDKTFKLNHQEISNKFQESFIDKRQVKTNLNFTQPSLFSPKPSFKSQFTIGPNLLYEKKSVFHTPHKDGQIRTFMPCYSNNANLCPNNLFLEEEKSKKILHSFLQPSNKVSNTLTPTNQSLCLFGGKEGKQEGNGEERKTERKGRVQGKKRNRKEQRIRG